MKIYTDITPDALVIISERLEEKSTVKWCGGDKPTKRTRLGFNKCLAFNYGDSGGLSHGLNGTYDGSLEKVTNREFVDLIVRKFPKVKPMPLSRMTKAQLISGIEKRDKRQVENEGDIISLNETISVLQKRIDEDAENIDNLQSEILDIKKEKENNSELHGNRLINDGKTIHFYRMRAEKAERDLSNLKESIMVLSGIAMGVDVKELFTGGTK